MDGVGSLWGGPITYLLLLLAAAGHLGLGRLLLGSRDPWRNLLVGLVVTAGTGSALAWSYAGAALSTIRVLLVIGLASLAWWMVAERARLALPTVRRMVAGGGVAVLLLVPVMLPFADLHWQFYAYNGQDLPYFIPFLEVVLADYLSPLRAATFYPVLSATTHLAPTTGLVALCGFLPKATMVHGTEARFLLVTAFAVRLAWRLWTGSGRANLAAFLLAMLGLMLVFGVEMRVVASGSTYLYLLLVWEFVLLALVPGDRDGVDARLCAALALMPAMVMAKLPIGYAAMITGLFLLWRAPRRVFHPAVLTVGTISVVNVLIVMVRPKPFAEVNMAYSLVNPFTGKPPLDYFLKFGDGLVNKLWLADYIGPATQVGIVGILAVVLIKTWLMPMTALRWSPSERAGGGAVLRQGLVVYLVAALLGWVFVRNSQHGLTHQAWFPFLAFSVAWPAAQLAAARSRRWLLGCCLAGLIYAVPGTAPAFEAWRSLHGKPLAIFGGLTYAELVSTPVDVLLSQRAGEMPDQVGIRAVLIGQRLYAGKVPPAFSGSYAEWFLPMEADHAR